MQLPRMDPTTDDVRHWHSKYIERVKDLFGRYKAEYHDMYHRIDSSADRPEQLALEIW